MSVLRFAKNMPEFDLVNPPVTRQGEKLQRFALYVKRSIIGVEISGAHDKAYLHYGDGLPCAGFIMWADDSYYVESRKIKKQRGAIRERMHTKNLGQAVKTAKQYLIPYTPEEYMDAIKWEMQSATGTARMELINNARVEARIVFGDAYHQLPAPLVALVSAGEQEGFSNVSDLEHREALVATMKLHREGKEAEKQLEPDVCIIATYPNDKAQRQYFSYHTKKGSSDLLEGAVYNDANIPEEIQGKLAVLALVDNASPVAGVGVKKNDNVFWLYKT